MKILAIGSSRKDGNTEHIITLLGEALTRQAKQRGIPLEFETLPLRVKSLTLCKGCRACFNAGEKACPLKDDLLSIRERMLSADGVIFGSPVYVEDINGTMKTLIDRLAFTNHRPQFYNKSAVVFTNSGVGSSAHALTTLRRALSTWAFCVCKAERFRADALTSLDELRQKYGGRIERLANCLLNAVTKNRPTKPTFKQLLYFKVQQSYYRKPVKSSNEHDHLFWRQNGWLNPHCGYYMPYRANPLKVFFARLLGGMVAVFFV